MIQPTRFRLLSGQAGLALPIALIMLVAMILAALAASKNPQLASAVVTGGQALAAQSQLNFSRDRCSVI